MSIFSPADVPVLPIIPGMLPPSDSASQLKAEQDSKWIGEFTDELSVAISLRQWIKALDLVDQGQSSCIFHL
jgi:hypothetical protein